MKQFLIALKATLVLTLLTGVMYPLLVTGLAKALFPGKAGGSLIQSHGRTVGSELIGQRFTKPEYFHGRPSAAGNDGYDGLSSGGSNLGPTNQKLADRVTADVKTFRAENPTFTGAVPGPRRRGPRYQPRFSPPIGRRQYRRPSGGCVGRAPRQRPEAQPRPGRPEVGQAGVPSGSACLFSSSP
jgi:K+-transporting ATPase ATPase C chain